MATATYSISKAQQKFPRLARTKSVVTVTNRGEVACFIVSKEFMTAAFETQEILSSTKAMKAIRSYQAGKLEFGMLDEISESDL